MICLDDLRDLRVGGQLTFKFTLENEFFCSLRTL